MVHIAEADVNGIPFLMFSARRRYGVESGARNDTKIFMCSYDKEVADLKVEELI